jgi:putative ABC transport system substrate-binding protein
MRRRDFLSVLSGAVVVWPFAGRAQQLTMPVIGFLNSGSPGPYRHLVAGFQQGLKESGYVEGENVVIEYRWAEGQYDRLSGMAAELIRRRVNVIAAMTTPAALAAEAAATTIPIVFDTAGDPVRLGLVVSLNRPGRNITGITQLGSELVAKRLGLLRDLIPTATRSPPTCRSYSQSSSNSSSI